EGILMGHKAGTALLLFGCLLMAAGLLFLSAAFGYRTDDSIVGAGMCAFSLGALVGAGGLYLKARTQNSAASLPGAKPQPKAVRGGCDLCGSESPVIHCRVHQLHICGNCLGPHYDFRSCAYVPSTRRSTPAKSTARFAAKA
ncbi:MAG TPA: hypothetical protein VFB00_03840, partial [Terriglobales bacterium]|nr:hypothetical protein [Terriglobales bacterium]